MARSSGGRPALGLWLLAICGLPLVVPVVVYRSIVKDFCMLVLPAQIKNGIVAVAIRTGIAVAIIALALSLLTCVFIVWRRSRNPKGLAFVVAVDTLLAAAFFLAPWLAVGLASGELPGDIISLWIGPGVAIRALPCLCAAMAGFAFAGLTRSRERHLEPAV